MCDLQEYTKPENHSKLLGVAWHEGEAHRGVTRGPVTKDAVCQSRGVSTVARRLRGMDPQTVGGTVMLREPRRSPPAHGLPVLLETDPVLRVKRGSERGGGRGEKAWGHPPLVEPSHGGLTVPAWPLEV